MKSIFSANTKMNEKGFTLIELLIVVIILAVLAAIVIPQFSSSTKDAQEAALDSTLTEMRNAIELYYHQHSSTYPGANTVAGVAAPAGDAAAFLAQLTKYTNATGVVVDVKDATHTYGPYLKKQELPKNPIDTLSTVAMSVTGDLTDPAAATGVGGWWFDSVSGKFICNVVGYETR